MSYNLAVSIYQSRYDCGDPKYADEIEKAYQKYQSFEKCTNALSNAAAIIGAISIAFFSFGFLAMAGSGCSARALEGAIFAFVGGITVSLILGLISVSRESSLKELGGISSTHQREMKFYRSPSYEPASYIRVQEIR
jgi:hypothetical protein